MADSVSYKKHFEDFLEATQAERARAESRRDYRDLKQWTTQQAAVLEARGQAAIVFDQFSKKVDAIVGLEVERRSDPKAYPVNPKHAKAADAITDALRYVEQNTFFDDTATEVFEDKLVEGYGGAIVEIDKETQKIEINQIPWDRIYFDPFSRKKDFSDAKYMGITLWLDIDDAIAIQPDKKAEIKSLLEIQHDEDTTFEDRPNNWVNAKRKRVRINQEYCLKDGKWMELFYSADTVISEKPSPYLDCDGQPCNPIELASDYIDRDNNRWGYMERLKDVQNEINHRRSKALFMLSSLTIMAEKGTFGENDREMILQEFRKGMTFIEYNSVGGKEPIIDRQQELGQSQLAFYQDAQQAMDSVGINPELTGNTDSAVSGRAFLARQQGGMMELKRIFARHSEWKTRIYRQIWARIKQFWTDEKWVRVTDNEDATKFVGLNAPILAIEKMMEQQTGMDIMDIRDKNPEVVEQFIQEAIAQDPRMGQVVETRNNVVEINMDIVVEEAPDTVTLQQEQFDTLAQLAGTRADPLMFKALVKLSNITRKDEVLEMFEPNSQEQQQQAAIQQKMMQLQEAKTTAEIKEILTKSTLNEASAKDKLASAIERVNNASQVQLGA